MLKDLLINAAPWLANAVGGPLAGMAVKAIGNALGQPDATPDAVVQALAAATPDQILQLKQAEADFELKMRELGFQNAEKLEGIAAADRDSARRREVELKDYTPRILAYSILTLYALVQVAIFTMSVDEQMRDMAMRSMGTLDAALGLVLGYYFGTTASSQRKTDLLHKASQKD